MRIRPGHPHLTMARPRSGRVYTAAKRVLDILAASAVLALFWPVMALIAFAVSLDSPGPVIFRHRRVGLHGKDFEFFKFRTMMCLDGSEDGMFTPGDQCRVTRVGRFLRRSKLDELPQFLNVLRGDISLVGPRPEVRKWVDAHPERWALLHTVKPGIFDAAVAVFRNEETLLAQTANPLQEYEMVVLPVKLTLNERYVRNRCVTADVVILARGLLALCTHEHRSRMEKGATSAANTEKECPQDIRIMR